jgi:negative regulator of replication initiation
MSRLMNPEIREYAVRCYVERGMSPTEVVEEIAGKFNVRYRPTQMRQFLSRGGYAEQRRAVDRQVTKIISEAAIAEIAKSRAAKPEELLQEWARQLIAVTQKSLDAAAKSERVRDIASATSAAATAIRTFRNCAGLESVPPPVKTCGYTYDFGSYKVPLARKEPEAMEVVTRELEGPAAP